ncbi:MAG: hypothetical protein MZV70_03500 [Desulfobacterales bacterium]|nr:hypothetical protein [Desulfobacterales bacterium]
MGNDILQWLLISKMFGDKGKTTTQMGQPPVPPQSGMGQMGSQAVAGMTPPRPTRASSLSPPLRQMSRVQRRRRHKNNGMVDYQQLLQMLMMLGER